jgi:ABC-type phosphate/phosphonate transport system substrate-binding protein
MTDKQQTRRDTTLDDIHSLVSATATLSDDIKNQVCMFWKSAPSCPSMFSVRTNLSRATIQGLHRLFNALYSG